MGSVKKYEEELKENAQALVVSMMYYYEQKKYLKNIVSYEYALAAINKLKERGHKTEFLVWRDGSYIVPARLVIDDIELNWT